MTVQTRVALSAVARARSVTAVLGPTNTGKTHLAIERMLAHGSGLIGLPLRLLAREVYGRLVARAGEAAVSLVTGEEKITPPNARYVVSTVEAMPRETDAAFVAIDEVQLAGDLERGRVFTDRILSVRGTGETLLLGALTARPLLEKLLPGINVVVRPRMSVLTYAGSKKITRLPPRSAIVAFSADEVYAIAELVRRQRGGAAVVLGSLSPRTRNAQVELFQNGDVEYLVATDAIGMGLNLDLDHVAFAGNRKFDGYQYRQLNPAELGQIAGRAGRHMRDGTFGVTGRAQPLDDDVVEQLESHRFQALKVFQWRNPDLDFTSLETLQRSLDEPPREEGLTRAPPSEDVVSLEHAARDPEVRDLARGRARVALLWDVCQVPDYRKIAPANHADLILGLYGFLAREGAIPDDWFARQVAFADRTEGDIDTLANRIAHIRTWTYVANRGNWLTDPAHWRGITKDIEDRLSDALHERLIARFVDRRTSVLMRRLRENAMLEAEITPQGDVTVEGQPVGRLHGFRFVAAAGGDGPDGKALRAAAAKALSSEIEARADKLGRAGDGEFVLSSDGAVRWLGEPVAKLIAGDDVLRPGFTLIADETLTGPARETVQTRIAAWITAQIGTLLKPLLDLRDASTLTGIARGLAFRLSEALGVVERSTVAEEAKSLDQAARAGLRALGVRFGAYHLFVPALLKPGPSRFIATLWALKNADFDVAGLAEVPQLSASGRTSIPVDPAVPVELYRVCGYKVAGNRAVRIDILERLADIIRPILAWRPGPDAGAPPEGAHPGGGFMVTVRMTSLVGCAGEDFSSILKALGYRVEKRPAPAPAAEQPAAAVSEAVAEAAPAATMAEGGTEGEAAAELPDTAGPLGDDAAEDAAGAPVDESVSVEESAAGDADAVPEAVAPLLAESGEPVDAPTETGEPEAAGTETAEGDAVATSEATAAAPGTEPQGADASAAEPAMVEVWRPGRSGGDRRPDRHRGRSGGPRREGEAARESRPQRSGRPEGRDQRRDGPRERRPDAAAGRTEAGRGDRPGSNRPNREEARGDRQRRDAPRAEPRRQTVDPNSPFAALAALKADLEKRDRER